MILFKQLKLTRVSVSRVDISIKVYIGEFNSEFSSTHLLNVVFLRERLAFATLTNCLFVLVSNFVQLERFLL